MQLSIIIPVFNEEENVKPLYSDIMSTIKRKYTYEILFIDDGSTDNTLENILKLKKRDRNVQVISFRKNFGKADALNAGFAKSKGDIVITMDGDLQDNPIEIPRFIKKIEEGFDMVSGWKFNRKDPLGKRLPSKFFNRLTRYLTGIKLHDFNCGFKAYKSEVVKQLRLYGELHRYVPALASWQGFTVGEIKVQHRRRQFGNSKYGWERLMKGFLDLFTINYLGSYRNRPLHLFGTIGLTLSALGVLIGLYLTSLWIDGYSIGDRPLLLLGILLIVLGIQVLSIGLIADLINFNHHNAQNSESKVKLSTVK